MKIRCIQIRKEEPNIIYFKYAFEDADFEAIQVTGKSRRGHPSKESMCEPPKKYPGRIPISVAKKNDLISLCKSGVIPEDYHTFYENIPSASKTNDHLPLPDALCADIHIHNYGFKFTHVSSSIVYIVQMILVQATLHFVHLKLTINVCNQPPT